MTCNEAIKEFTIKDFGYLLRTNKSFRDAYNQTVMFFDGVIVSEKLLLEIESIIKDKLHEKK